MGQKYSERKIYLKVDRVPSSKLKIKKEEVYRWVLRKFFDSKLESCEYEFYFKCCKSYYGVRKTLGWSTIERSK